VRVTVLGAHGTWPSAGGATSGHLIQHDEWSLLVDLGTGCLANLQRHMGLFDVDAVLISHSHPDHLTDLYTYLMARMFSPERPGRIPLILAPKILDRFSPLLSDDSGDMKVAEVFEIKVVEPSEDVQVGAFTIRTAPMAHSVPTIGVRVEAGGGALAYSADTGPADEVVELSRQADLLIAEATWQEDGAARPPIHMTAREAGEVAARAGVDELMLTHIRPYLDRDRSREEAAGSFDGEVLLATEGQVREVR
jgi:ribonuclease BN (tRNA processing enzyme)